MVELDCIVEKKIGGFVVVVYFVGCIVWLSLVDCTVVVVVAVGWLAGCIVENKFGYFVDYFVEHIVWLMVGYFVVDYFAAGCYIVDCCLDFGMDWEAMNTLTK